jgi:vitamin B12 transporter
MNLFKISLLTTCFCHAFEGLAQQSIDTVLQLRTVDVIAPRVANFSTGTKIQKIDSATLSRYSSGNLSTLLENESPLFIKSYGLGSLAVSSFRGGSASHTATLWNGFNLNSPMYGQLDFALVPTGFINNVSIQYGGTSALWGSGAVGGTIHLNSDATFNKGITVLAGSNFGSFESYGQNLLVEISKQKWISSIKLLNNSANNGVYFYNTQLAGSPKVKQSNAELKQYGLLFENYFKINEGQKINIRFWYQNTDRNIPPTMLQTVNRSNQKDESYRLTSEWQRVGEKVNYYVRVAYFDEHLIYSDFAYDYRSLNRSHTVIAETESKIKFNKNSLLNIGVNNTFAKAMADGYLFEPRQNRIAVFSSYRFTSNNNKFLVTLSAREELIKTSFVPFTYSFGSEYTFFKWLSAKGNVSKVYRVPTLNDLYWNPGGNDSLLPESGYCEEAGVLMKWGGADSKINFSVEPTVFNRNMNNWILWLPGPTYWSPQNIMEVWSRGMETRSELGFRIYKAKIKINVSTNYVVSTNEKAKTDNDASVNKQLIYVPMYSGHAKISVAYKMFLLSCNQNYTGYRYTSTDNSEYLKPYSLTNVYASYKISFANYYVNLFVQVNNLLNTEYQVLLNRAMPLRNYQAGISIQFNKPNN